MCGGFSGMLLGGGVRYRERSCAERHEKLATVQHATPRGADGRFKRDRQNCTRHRWPTADRSPAYHLSIGSFLVKMRPTLQESRVQASNKTAILTECSNSRSLRYPVAACPSRRSDRVTFELLGHGVLLIFGAPSQHPIADGAGARPDDPISGRVRGAAGRVKFLAGRLPQG